jgi:ubiquinone/menaquinone biosynthesis C-methylase UbiE
MEKTGEIDIEQSEKIKSGWDEFVIAYQDFAENITIQSSMMLYSLTHARRFNKICEVGSGCGSAARMFISEIMKHDSVYFASDISTKMNETFKENFDRSDAALNPTIKLHHVEDTKDFNVERLVEDMGDVTKKCFVLDANNEKLPYPDGYFELYLSNLNLMIVNNHYNQLSEAYRILQEGGVAAFTVWGRPENSSFFTFFPSILKHVGIETPKPPRTLFHLGDKEKLEKDVRDAGFKSVKLFYTQTNLIPNSSEELYEFFSHSTNTKDLIANFTEEEATKVKEEMKKQFDEKFSGSTIHPMEWEVLICIAKK